MSDDDGYNNETTGDDFEIDVDAMSTVELKKRVLKRVHPENESSASGSDSGQTPVHRARRAQKLIYIPKSFSGFGKRIAGYLRDLPDAANAQLELLKSTTESTFGLEQSRQPFRALKANDEYGAFGNFVTLKLSYLSKINAAQVQVRLKKKILELAELNVMFLETHSDMRKPFEDYDPERADQGNTNELTMDSGSSSESDSSSESRGKLNPVPPKNVAFGNLITEELRVSKNAAELQILLVQSANAFASENDQRQQQRQQQQQFRALSVYDDYDAIGKMFAFQISNLSDADQLLFRQKLFETIQRFNTLAMGPPSETVASTSAAH